MGSEKLSASEAGHKQSIRSVCAWRRPEPLALAHAREEEQRSQRAAAWPTRVVRKHMGYSHIPQKFAKAINAFYQVVFNPWLNLHRPCMFAIDTVNAQGKVIKR